VTTIATYLARFITYELAKRTGYTWDSASGRYRSHTSGQYVAQADLKALSTNFSQYTRENLRTITERMIGGQIDLSTWQRQAAQELKESYITNMLISRGGVNAVTQADYGRQGGRLASEYRYLNNFAQEIASGNLSEAQILARIDQYGNGVQKAYYDGLTAANEEAGLTEERRILNDAEHCDDCVDYAAEGWVKIGTLPEPGEGSECRSNCQCEKEYR
jgi:hypothetical protein